MSLVHNEQTKLSATWLNTLATALIAAGALAPLAAVLYGLSAPTLGRGGLIAMALGCFAGGVVLHFVGRALLRNLQA